MREVRVELGRLSERAVESQRQVGARLDALDASVGARLEAIEESVARIETALDRLERSRPVPPRRDRGRLRTLPEVPSPDVALSAVLGDDPRRGE